MKNYVNAGKNLPVTLTAATAAGGGVMIGSIFGVAQGAGEAGDDVVLVREGVFELPKLEAQAWTVGVKVYWDSDNERCTTASSGNIAIGAAVAAAANPSDAGRVLLDGTIR